MKYPGVILEANSIARSAKKVYLTIVGVRIGSLLIGSLIGIVIGQMWMRWLIIFFLVLAFVLEVFLQIVRPERIWFDAREISEACKTLVWRFVVGCAPFEVKLAASDAEQMLIEKLRETIHYVKSPIYFHNKSQLLTQSMIKMRKSTFVSRKAFYIEQRIMRQVDWYLFKAKSNRIQGSLVRISLIAGECFVIISLIKGVSYGIDLATFGASVFAALAAWTSTKRFALLGSTYSSTAKKLSRQVDSMKDITEEEWSKAVVDTETIISEEHALWVVSGSNGLVIK